MVSRRATLALLGSALGGCVSGRGTPSPDRTPTPTDGTDPPPATDDPTPDPNTPPEGWPPADWTPDWTHGLPVSHVLGIDALDGRLLVTASDGQGPTVLQSYDPGARAVRWEREFAGEAVANSMHPGGTRPRIWGVTDAGDTLLSVTGRVDDREWAELHALDPATGEERWSLRRRRRLLVRGLADGAAYVVSRAFEEKSTDHHHGSDTPTPEPLAASLLAVDLADGSVRWSRDFTGVGDVAADDSGVYVTVMDRLLGFDHDGTRRWRVTGGSRGKRVCPTADVVYHVSKPEWDRTVVRGVGRDGSVRWTRRFRADESAAHDGRLYVAGDRLSALGPDGSLDWQADGYAGTLTFGPAGETVYVRTGAQADAVGAVALADGSRRWTFDPPITNAWPEGATAGTVVAGGIGEVGMPLYRVDAASGEATARYLDDDPLVTRPFGDHVFAGIGDYERGATLLALPV